MTAADAIAQAYRKLNGRDAPLSHQPLIRSIIGICDDPTPHGDAARLRRWSQVLADAARRLEETS
jgi:hypothetical protein